jgi:hypothetical protein
MAFPRKDTRRISVDGIPYVWHLDRDWDVHTRWIVIRRQVYGVGQLLMVNPYHHDLLPTRGTVGGANRFALKSGWRPERKAAPLRLTFAGRERGFQLALEPNETVRRTGASGSGLKRNRTPPPAGSGR